MDPHYSAALMDSSNKCRRWPRLIPPPHYHFPVRFIRRRNSSNWKAGRYSGKSGFVSAERTKFRIPETISRPKSIASRYSLFGKATATLQQCLTCAGIGWPPSLRVRATRDGFSCPYHGWTYDIDGRLFNAPRMPKEPALDRDACRLPSVRTEIWLGFIYVNLDQHAKPLAPRLAKLQGWIKNYHVENFRTVWHKQEIWQCNWKVMTENFHEAYHVTTLHPETLLPYGSNDLLRNCQSSIPVVGTIDSVSTRATS